LLASGSWDKTVRLWPVDQPSATPVILTGHTSKVFSVAFTPDGNTIVSGSADGTIRLWDVQHPEADPTVLSVPEPTP
jgi:WD40 repeat protein